MNVVMLKPDKKFVVQYFYLRGAEISNTRFIKVNTKG